MSGGVSIRRGEPDDLDQVIAMAQGSETAAHWREHDYSAIFQTKRILFIAESGKRIVGFVVAHDIAGEWELENIVVAADEQRHGVGKRLVAALVEEASKNAAEFIFLEVRESNIAARSLYESSGFQEYGRRKGYYANPSEDGLLYRFLCNPKSLEKC